MIVMVYLEIRIRQIFTNIWDYLKYISEEIRNEGKNDDEWILVQIEKPHRKIGSSK